MEETLARVLESDEHLIWQGKPEEFETLDKSYKKLFVNRVIIAIIAAAVIIAAYAFIILNKGVELNIFVRVVIAAASVLGPLSVFNYANKLRKKTVYAASNKRLIVYSGDLKTTEYEMIKTACFKKDEDGHTTLLCGKEAVNAAPSKWRMISLFGLNDLEAEGGPECERFGFYALENPEELREVLAPYLKIS